VGLEPRTIANIQPSSHS